jgi:hypothetical protein
MNKKRWWIIALVIVVLAIASFTLYKLFFENPVKTSVVTGTFSESYRDGCDGFKLANGDRFNKACFWESSGERPEYDRSIKVGDTVEYRIEGDDQFMRLKK